MKKEKIFMKSAGTRGYSPLARVMTLAVMLLAMATTGAWAQEQWDVVWDFTAWSAETVTALKADAATSKLEGWSDVEKKADAEAGADPTDATKDNCFWSCSGTVNADGNLSANGAVIKEFQGLKFNSDYAAQRKLAIAVNYPSTSLGTYHGPAYLYLGGKNRTCFTIPGVKAGSKITIEVESHKTSSARGIGLYKNSYAAENLIGEQFTPTTFEAKTWEIAEDCNVVVYNTNKCHIYTIKVKAPAAEPGKYTVAMAAEAGEGWTIEPAEATTTGVDKDTKITATYSGTKHVKSVTAVVKAAEPATVDLDASTKAWADGSAFAVPAGGLTYGDAVTVSGNVTLTLTEGTTLTLNKGISLADGATLTVQGNGTMNVNGTNNSTASTVAGTGTLVLTSGTLNAKGGNGQGVGDMNYDTDVRANAGGNAINGNVTVSGGTLTATGGNGGGVGEMSAYSYGAAGGVAISGSVTVTGGAVTATGGNGGSIGAYGAEEHGGNGGAAIGGDATISGGTWTASDGTHGVNGDGQGGDGGKAVAGTVTDNRN